MDQPVFILLSILIPIAALLGVWFGYKIGKKGAQTDTSTLVSKELYNREIKVADEAKAEAEHLRGELVQLNRQISAFEQERKDFERRIAEHGGEMEKLRDEFYKQFKLTASEILEKNTASFQEKSKIEVGNLLNPLKEKLQSFEKKVQDTYEKGLSERSALSTEIKKLVEQNQTLQAEASNLTRALKGDVKKQGNWGEVVLKRLLEISGLTEGKEFETQESYTTEDGRRLQPDVVIHLPDEKYVIVDSKVTLTAYERLVSAETDEDRDKALKEHLLAMYAHIDGLSKKEYQKLHGDKSPDFVLLFIPIEGAFNAALQNDNDLYQKAMEKNIVIVSTTTLLATLRTISSIWKQENRSRNIEAIANEGAKLYDKFVGFVDDLEKLGKQMKTAQSTYDDAMNKLSTGRGNLVNRAEKMKNLGLQTTKSLPSKLLEEDDQE